MYLLSEQKECPGLNNEPVSGKVKVAVCIVFFILISIQFNSICVHNSWIT